MLHTRALCSGWYFANPWLACRCGIMTYLIHTDKISRLVTLNRGESASAGTGTIISTLFAVERLLNWPFACSMSLHTNIHMWHFRGELTAHFNEIFHSTMWVSLNVWLNPDERLDLSIKSVRHELKLPIGWDKRNSPIILEPRETNTLMKLNIF